jgi:vacuolar-type H+-ATPase subunit B/Vma2
MLAILRDNDPTLRLACRSWLQESKTAYSRILDPILVEFMNETNLKQKANSQITFTQSFNTEYVTDNFDKLRDIILNLNTQSEFLEYIVTKKTGNLVKSKFRK